MRVELTEEEFTDRVQKIVAAVAGLGIRDVLQMLSASTLILTKIIADEGKCPCSHKRCIFTGNIVTITEKFIEQHLLPDLEKIVENSPSPTPHIRPLKQNIH